MPLLWGDPRPYYQRPSRHDSAKAVAFCGVALIVLAAIRLLLG